MIGLRGVFKSLASHVLEGARAIFSDASLTVIATFFLSSKQRNKRHPERRLAGQPSFLFDGGSDDGGNLGDPIHRKPAQFHIAADHGMIICYVDADDFIPLPISGNPSVQFAKVGDDLGGFRGDIP